MFAACEAVSSAELDRQCGGSFGTGRALLTHVVGVERLWYERWKGNSFKAIPTYPPETDGRRFMRLWQGVNAEEQRYFDALTPDALAGDLTYSSLDGAQRALPLEELLMHLVNHGTYHRGQISYLLRDLCLKPPGTDYLLFMMER